MLLITVHIEKSNQYIAILSICIDILTVYIAYKICFTIRHINDIIAKSLDLLISYLMTEPII